MFSATDVANFLACHHTATLDRAEIRKEIKKPFFNDPSIALLQALGLEHEKKYLRQLIEAEGRSVVQIDLGLPWEEARSQTCAALHRGADAIYQATFLDQAWRGRADFLIRVETPCELGAWSYEAVDTKLAHSTKAAAVVQLCFYSDLLARIQGVEPQFMHVVLGGGVEPERFPVQRYIAYFRKVRREYESAWKAEANTYPEPVEQCDVCSWLSICDKRRRADDHLSLVAGISRTQRKALVERGVVTTVDLARLSLPISPKIERIGNSALVRIHEQARLQVAGREAGRACYELLESVNPGEGLAALPLPSAGDMFLDLESNPYVLDQGLEYLFGMVTLPPDAKSEPRYEVLWSFTRAEEKEAFETFMAMVMERWQQDPAMHIYHYAPYEPSAIKRLVGRHGTFIEELDELLRTEIFVDLYRVVRQGLRASVEGYSIKRLEPLYGFKRSVALHDANMALKSYEAMLALGGNCAASADLLRTIEGYNRDDCFSTLRLRGWLEECRIELEKRSNCVLTRPEVKSGEAGIDLAAQLDEMEEVKSRLLEDLPADQEQWDEEQRARWLLAQLLEWHRREEKSMWWEYFRLRALSDLELVEDKSALGKLEYEGVTDKVRRSTIHRYSFPAQDHSIDRALEVHDPRTGASAGEVVLLDERRGIIDLRRGNNSSVTHPTALIPYDYIPAKVLSESVLRIAKWVADNSVNGPGEYKAARDLLLRRGPVALKQVREVPIGEDGQLTETAKELMVSLAAEPGVLPIQGPPGSGKTFTGARMIVELVRQGRRVGISALSHKVISYLLNEVCATASANNVSLRAIQKHNEKDGCDLECVTSAKNDQEVANALASGLAQVAAGTPWLWASPLMANSVDVLFIDEAGQVSLANTLAVSQAATSVVLLGDPQQLDQPLRGTHPPGAEVSALGHLLNGRKTIDTDRGLFLTETRRLHPAVCSFISEIFYDGRLLPRPENAKQRLNVSGTLDGTGLRFAAVKHSGNQNESPEEVEKVAALVDFLLRNGATWTDKNGTLRPLELADILIVAPYNAQVAALDGALPPNARVGTVDKFQGREAPIVLYSMATSSPEDAPRGMEFLYSMNRLNVAVSRARCVAVIVANPDLFDVQCKTPRQIELTNAFCRYLELAETV